MLNDGLIVPSPVFSKQTSFFKYVNKSPLSCTFRINASGYLIPLFSAIQLLEIFSFLTRCSSSSRRPRREHQQKRYSCVTQGIDLSAED